MSQYASSRAYVYRMFDVGAGGRFGYYIDSFILVLIIANVVAVTLETVDPLYAAYGREFYGFELISVVIFSIEYLGRLWAATENPEYDHWFWGRLRFARTPYMIIDFLAIVPFFLGAIVDLRFLRMLRLFRFLRLFKLARYDESMVLFTRVIRRKKSDLVVTFSATGLLLLLASSVMYFVETEAQPEAFSSIPATLWWGVVTLTTVGYGDVHPITPLGQFFGAIVAVLGIGLFALPASILASGFIEAAGVEEDEIAADEELEFGYCPCCGEDLDQYRNG
jgi:voltage-gated potassium channel